MIDTQDLRRKLHSTDLIDHITIHADVKPVLAELLDRLEVAEKDIGLKERIIDSLGVTLTAVVNERDELRANIEEMEKQEPVTAQQRFQRQQEMMAVWLPWQTTALRKGRPARTVDVLGLDVEYRELYLASGAQSAPSVRPASLYPVINWLRNGCDPMMAADELEILTAAPEAKP